VGNRRFRDPLDEDTGRPMRPEVRTDMANTPQAKKRIRRNENRAEINGARMSRIRSFVKKVETAIAGGDKTAAAEALRAAQPELARGVARGVVHKNTVARKMSRLSKRVAALWFAFLGINQGTKLERGRRIFRRPFLRLRRVKFALAETRRIPAIRRTVILFVGRIQALERTAAGSRRVKSIYFNFFIAAVLPTVTSGS